MAFQGVEGGNSADATDTTTNTRTIAAGTTGTPTPTQTAAAKAQSEQQAALKVLQAQTTLRMTPRQTPARASRARRETVAKIKAPVKVVKKKIAVTTVLPISGDFTLTAEFGQGGSRWATVHTGQDFAVPSGTPVHVVAAGKVVSAGWGGAYGNRIVVKHSDGRYTTYNHLSVIQVSVGESVVMGEKIAKSGNTGNTTGPHLHFEVLNSAMTPIGPMTWLRSRGVKI